MDKLRPPQACQTMAMLRDQIDTLDAALITLLATRARYIDRAIELKKIEGLPARAPDRVAQVLDNVAQAASRQGLDPELARALWAELIEWSIARESKVLGP